MDIHSIQYCILDMIKELEEAIIKPDQITEAGINMHLRNVWALRDKINLYFKDLDND